VRRAIRDNSIALFFGLAFLGALVGQAIAGHSAHNAEQLAHGEETISLGRYLVSSEFGQAVMENWQSEYLQFLLFIVATVWLVQKGSPESKAPHKSGRGTDKEEELGEHASHLAPRWAKVGGFRTWLYSNSLGLLMGVIFLAAWFSHSVTGWSAYNAEQRTHDADTVSWAGYVGTSDFWETTLQNWQSEFLAVGSMAVFAIYLRQRGSPESKAVGAPHQRTGTE
jgi:hypothetical protein